MLGCGDPVSLKKGKRFLLLRDQEREGGKGGHPARILRQIGFRANGDETTVGPDHDLRPKVLEDARERGHLLGGVGAEGEGELLGQGFGFRIVRQRG
jgi:hypothetical protein